MLLGDTVPGQRTPVAVWATRRDIVVIIIAFLVPLDKEHAVHVLLLDCYSRQLGVELRGPTGRQLGVELTGPSPSAQSSVA